MPADFITQKPLHSSKVTAWCALSYRGIIGPFWFEDEDENAVTINRIAEELFRRFVLTFVGEETLLSVHSGFNKMGLLHTLPRTLLNFFGKNLKTV